MTAERCNSNLLSHASRPSPERPWAKVEGAWSLPVALVNTHRVWREEVDRGTGSETAARRETGVHENGHDFGQSGGSGLGGEGPTEFAVIWR